MHMRFSDIKGNDEVKRTLTAMVDSGRIPHALMFHEDEGSGAFAMAQAFLGYLFSHAYENEAELNRVSKMIHPDVHYVFPLNSGTKVTGKIDELNPDRFMEWFRELAISKPDFLESDLYDAIGIAGKSGTIASGSARYILDKLMLSSVEGGWKAVVIWLPEKMNASAANRLLKIIEEPPSMTVFILITQNPDGVIQTIVSRCLRIRIMPRYGILDRADYQANLDLFRQLCSALLSRDLDACLDVGEALAALESRDRQKAFCRFSCDCLRRIFLIQQGMDSLAGQYESDEDYFTMLAGSFKKSFPHAAMPLFDRSYSLVERNVNQKILFCDLVGRLYNMI